MTNTTSDKICTMDDTREINALKRDATVSCRLCGTKAHDPGNVCDPVQLPEAGHLGD